LRRFGSGSSSAEATGPSAVTYEFGESDFSERLCRANFLGDDFPVRGSDPSLCLSKETFALDPLDIPTP
jgi:hypothetical protein